MAGLVHRRGLGRRVARLREQLLADSVGLDQLAPSAALERPPEIRLPEPGAPTMMTSAGHRSPDDDR